MTPKAGFAFLPPLRFNSYMDMVLPDYHGGGIVNLMASIENACGGRSAYATLRGLPPQSLGGGTVVLLVIDGLGYEHLLKAQAGNALRRCLQGRISSVFPSTTASAITTFMTGLAPQQHGLTGWFTYLREIGSVTAVLPFRPRAVGNSLREMGIGAAELFGHVPFFDKIRRPSWVLSPQWIVHSEFNASHAGRAERVGYQSLEQMFGALARIVRGQAEPGYVYAYYPELDSLAHEYGIASPQAAACLEKLDAAFARFLDDMAGSGCTVIVTADHGFIDGGAGSLIELERHPALAQTLVLPLCGEPRAAYCYVHPRQTEAFERYVRSELAQQAMLYDSRQLINDGWFGPGEPHPRLAERVGHYTLVMRENYALKDWLPGEKHYTHIGMHGGVSAAEMGVPLVVARV
ncbi:MAG: alkaline phosphatase family protein [Burkholderiales bacterium]